MTKEKDHMVIILEEMRSEFKIFGELLMGFGEKLEDVKKKGDATFEELGKVKIEIVEIKGDIKEINSRLDNIEEEIKSIRMDFDLVKNELKRKVDVEYIEKIEERITRIEKHLEIAC